MTLADRISLLQKYLLVSLLFLIVPLSATAQIINVEDLRLSNRGEGLHLSENLDFSVVKNTVQLVTITNNLAAQYRTGHHLLLFLNNINVNISQATDFERDGFIHLRYGYRVTRRVTGELFTQYQVDVPLRIANRILTGAGPRITLLKSPRQQLISGHLVMYEHDEERGNEITNRDWRLSSYLTYELRGESGTGFTTIFYYQPRLDRFADYRLSGQAQFSVRLSEALRFTATASLYYDAFPVQDPAIPNLTYKVSNGIRVLF